MGPEKTLVVFLTMHRSGSSAATRVFRELGLSLGPFRLLGANPSNPHGHFEAEPFVALNQEIQEAAFGFRDDLPPGREALDRFLAGQGVWPAEVRLRPGWVARGQELVAALLASGLVAGFKDPRTPLVWPFWATVFASFAGVWVVPVVLLRSPHEIAMSLFTRSGGRYGYRESLSVVEVHYRAIRRALAGHPGFVPRVVFGGSDYPGELRRAAETCGLGWSDARFAAAFDPACLHHRPAVVEHAAERAFEELAGLPRRDPGSADNLARLLADAAEREAILGPAAASAAAGHEELCRALADRDAARAEVAALSAAWSLRAARALGRPAARLGRWLRGDGRAVGRNRACSLPRPSPPAEAGSREHEGVRE